MTLYELQPSGLLMCRTAEEKKREGTEGWKPNVEDVLVQLWKNIKFTSYKYQKKKCR